MAALAKKCERGTSDGLKIAAEAALKADIIVMTCLWKKQSGDQVEEKLEQDLNRTCEPSTEVRKLEFAVHASPALALPNRQINRARTVARCGSYNMSILFV